MLVLSRANFGSLIYDSDGLKSDHQAERHRLHGVNQEGRWQPCLDGYALLAQITSTF